MCTFKKLKGAYALVSIAARCFFHFDPFSIVIERHLRRRKNKVLKRIILIIWKSLRLQRIRRAVKGIPFFNFYFFGGGPSARAS